MKEYFEKTIPLIDKALRECFPKEIDQSWFDSKLDDDYEFDTSVWESVWSEPFYELFERKSKRFRPVLMCLTHDALGGKDPEIYKLSTMPELLHTGSLIMDDIEDNSDYRRGKEAIHKIYGPSIAMNCANLTYFLPYLVVEDSNLSDSKKLKLYSLLGKKLIMLHFGQGMDIKLANKNTSDVEQKYLRTMNHLKTGELLSFSAEAGGIVADAPTEKIKNLGKVAGWIGEAFQIRDDILNIQPVSEEWGKERGEDIIHGEANYTISLFYKLAKRKDKESFNKIVNSKSKHIVDKAVNIMKKYDVFNISQNYAEDLVSKSKDIVSEVLPDTEYKEYWLNMLDYTVNRQK